MSLQNTRRDERDVCSLWNTGPYVAHGLAVGGTDVVHNHKIGTFDIESVQFSGIIP